MGKGYLAALVLVAIGIGFFAGGVLPLRHEPTQLHAILRPDENGRWFIQSDADHEPFGISTTVEQTETDLRIFMCCGAPVGNVGTIQITSDDQFNTAITGHAGMGQNVARIDVRANGELINPADVWDYLPNKDGGNFWVNITMMPARP